jgi:hypothetical protein
LAVKDAPLKILFDKYQSNGILLDANLLLLLALGGLDRRLVGQGRISSFVSEDFRQLNQIVANFRVRLTTPNILTEVDDLGRKDVKGRERQFRDIMKKLELRMTEIFVQSRTILADSDTEWLGLADGVSLKIDQPYLLLTTDAQLWSKASRIGIDAMNWNHLRQQWL